jgi:hypothetical protein
VLLVVAKETAGQHPEKSIGVEFRTSPMTSLHPHNSTRRPLMSFGAGVNYSQH